MNDFCEVLKPDALVRSFESFAIGLREEIDFTQRVSAGAFLTGLQQSVQKSSKYRGAALQVARTVKRNPHMRDLYQQANDLRVAVVQADTFFACDNLVSDMAQEIITGFAPESTSDALCQILRFNGQSAFAAYACFVDAVNSPDVKRRVNSMTLLDPLIRVSGCTDDRFAGYYLSIVASRNDYRERVAVSKPLIALAETAPSPDAAFELAAYLATDDRMFSEIVVPEVRPTDGRDVVPAASVPVSLDVPKDPKAVNEYIRKFGELLQQDRNGRHVPEKDFRELSLGIACYPIEGVWVNPDPATGALVLAQQVIRQRDGFFKEVQKSALGVVTRIAMLCPGMASQAIALFDQCNVPLTSPKRAAVSKAEKTIAAMQPYAQQGQRWSLLGMTKVLHTLNS